MKEVRIAQMDFGDGLKNYVSLWVGGKVIPNGSGYAFKLGEYERMGVFISKFFDGSLKEWEKNVITLTQEEWEKWLGGV